MVLFHLRTRERAETVLTDGSSLDKIGSRRNKKVTPTEFLTIEIDVGTLFFLPISLIFFVEELRWFGSNHRMALWASPSLLHLRMKKRSFEHYYLYKKRQLLFSKNVQFDSKFLLLEMCFDEERPDGMQSLQIFIKNCKHFL